MRKPLSKKEKKALWGRVLCAVLCFVFAGVLFTAVTPEVQERAYKGLGKFLWSFPAYLAMSLSIYTLAAAVRRPGPMAGHSAILLGLTALLARFLPGLTGADASVLPVGCLIAWLGTAATLAVGCMDISRQSREKSKKALR